MFFDGSACDDGQEIGAVLISPNGTIFEFSNRLEEECTNNQVEYDLAYESLRAIKGQIVADFIVEHQINDEHDLEVGYITCTPWKLYFDGSVCDDGQGDWCYSYFSEWCCF